MTTQKTQIFTISTSAGKGAVHTVPADLRKTLTTSKAVGVAWNDITPLARNEWICWIISAKKSQTRDSRIRRTVDMLNNGKRRPCCWAGCPHR